VPLWVIAVLIIAVIWNTGGFAGMLLQRTTEAVDPSGAGYQIEVEPTGMPWIGTFNWDLSWLAAPVHWVRYLRQNPRTWSVSVAKIEKRSVGQDLLKESFGTYREARLRFRELKARIQVGELSLGQET
jgi:hypothetical protein